MNRFVIVLDENVNQCCPYTPSALPLLGLPVTAHVASAAGALEAQKTVVTTQAGLGVTALGRAAGGTRRWCRLPPEADHFMRSNQLSTLCQIQRDQLS